MHAPNSAGQNSAGRQEDHGRLVICPTPIGNLRDITLRTLDALANCDYVCAEDTRVTAKLLNAYNISKPLIRMDENTIKRKASRVIADIQAGKQVCYCSDAGMPGVSDPGIALLALAYEQHVFSMCATWSKRFNYSICCKCIIVFKLLFCRLSST